MGAYGTEQFADAARALPKGLVTALGRDEGVTAVEYLAGAAAATDAGEVLDALAGDRVTVLGSRLEGTEFFVSVASKDAAAVAATGATPVVAKPTAPKFSSKNLRFAASNLSDRELSGGESLYFEDKKNGYRCSVGFTGYRLSDHAPQLVTAGHCIAKGVKSYSFLGQSRPNRFDSVGPTVGKPVSGSFHLGRGYDSGLIGIRSGWKPTPTVLTWHGTRTGAPDETMKVRDRIPAVVGATLCKSGATSGWTCGEVLAVDYLQNVEGATVTSIIADTCMLAGDSGGSAVIGDAAVGINSWSSFRTCSDPTAISGFFPLAPTSGSRSIASLFRSTWEPAVAVDTPVSTSWSSSPEPYGTAVSGTITNANPRTRVEITMAGKKYRVPVAADGSWSFESWGVEAGASLWYSTGRWGTWSKSVAAPTRVLQIAAPELVTIAGGDNAVAAAIDTAKAQHPDGAATVYLANPTQTTDVYAAASGSLSTGAPALLSTATVPAEVIAALKDLGATRVIVAGTSGHISAGSLAVLRANGFTVNVVSDDALNAAARG